MADVSEAANRIYVISEHGPRQLALIAKAGGEPQVYGIRAHNPLGRQWRTVYELFEGSESLVDEPVGDVRAPDLEVDGYWFWFNANSCCALPTNLTDLNL